MLEDKPRLSKPKSKSQYTDSTVQISNCRKRSAAMNKLKIMPLIFLCHVLRSIACSNGSSTTTQASMQVAIIYHYRGGVLLPHNGKVLPGLKPHFHLFQLHCDPYFFHHECTSTTGRWATPSWQCATSRFWTQTRNNVAPALFGGRLPFWGMLYEWL